MPKEFSKRHNEVWLIGTRDNEALPGLRMAIEEGLGFDIIEQPHAATARTHLSKTHAIAVVDKGDELKRVGRSLTPESEHLAELRDRIAIEGIKYTVLGDNPDIKATIEWLGTIDPNLAPVADHIKKPPQIALAPEPPEAMAG